MASVDDVLLSLEKLVPSVALLWCTATSWALVTRTATSSLEKVLWEIVTSLPNTLTPEPLLVKVLSVTTASVALTSTPIWLFLN